MRRTAFFSAIVMILALGGCSCVRQPEALPDDPIDNASDIVSVNTTVEAAPPPPPPLVLNITNEAVPAVPPPPTLAQDEQMRDDADATGMTARLPEDAMPADTANATQPVDKTTEQK